MTFSELFPMMCFSPFPRAAQSAGPERRELPQHSPTPGKSHSLCKPHCAAGSHLHFPVHFYQSALHPQQFSTASAPQKRKQFGTTAPKSQRQPVNCSSQLPSSPSLLCRNKWSSACEQNHPTHTQVRTYVLNADQNTEFKHVVHPFGKETK